MEAHLLHLIKDSECYLAFDPSSMTLLELPPTTFKCLELFQVGYGTNSIANELGINEESIHKLIDKIQQYKPSAIETKTTEQNKKRSISRITLHVSNDCNLRCRYCYAHGGSYHMNRSLMSMNTANHFIEYVRREYDNVDRIVFFGGEPFINWKVIDHICSILKEMFKRKEITFLPEFGVITNGYFTSNKVFDVIAKHLDSLTVSIDGSEEIHNYNRKNVKGEGSFETVAQFIKKVKTLKNVSVGYEATYTKRHKELGITRNDIKQYLEKEFGINGTITEEYGIEKESLFQNRNEIEKNRVEQALFWDVLSRLVSKQPAYMCPIAKNIISVSTDGNIYPCHMLNGIKNNTIGNIYTIGTNDNINHNKKNHCSVLMGNPKNNLACKSCWVNPFCGGCTKLWFYNEYTKKFNKNPHKKTCDNYRKYISNTLLSIGKIRRDSTEWQKLISKIKNNTTL